MKSSFWVAALVLATIIPSQHAHAAVSFTPLGYPEGYGSPHLTEAFAVSDDGQTVVGRFNPYNEEYAITWTREDGMVILGPGKAYGVSEDGSIVVGVATQTPTQLSGGTPGIWANGELRPAMPVDESGEPLTRIIPAQRPGDVDRVVPVVIYGVYTALSTQTGVAVGYQEYPRGYDGEIRGTIESGQVVMHEDGNRLRIANDVTPDGSVIVGMSTEGNAARRTETGIEELVNQDFERVIRSEALGVNADGSVVVGYVLSGGGSIRHIAFRWTQATGMVSLGTHPDLYSSVARAVSADGSVVVGGRDWGYESTLSGGGFVWTEKDGFQLIEDILTDNGIDMSDWSGLYLYDITPDGKTVVGTGYGPNGIEGFIATIPEPAATAILLPLLPLLARRP